MSDSKRTNPDNKQRPLKVCLASRAPFIGGAEVAAERLAIGLRDAGHEVFLLLAQSGEVQERFERAGLRCLVTPLFLDDKRYFLRHFFSRRTLRGILRKENPDVIHSNDLPTHQMVSGVAGRLGIPRICHHRFGYNGAAIDWFNKYGAERHVFVSQALMAELCAGSQRLHESCRAVVYDGLPCPPLSSIESKAHARATLGLDASRKVVVFAGQIIERKGVADLLRSWAALGPELAAQNELIIVGDDLAGKGAYRLEMERLAQGLGCGARFVGFQKNVHEWLSAADVAVVPSHVEPLGNATLEAMAHGLPVIGTSVGGIPEMVVHERTGLLVPPKTPAALAVALTRFLTDERLRLQCGANGRLRCEERFSLMAHTLAALEEYAKVVGQSQ